MGGSREGRPGGVHTDLEKYESKLRQRWTERATKKNDSIIGAGYAERQIRNTLAMVSKIKTEL